MSLNPLAVGFLASIHRMVEMQTQGPKENHPSQDISAALAGLGASSGSSNLVPNPLLNCLNQDAKPETALNNNYRSVSMAHKRANLERKIAAMRRQKEKENADCLGLGLGLGLGLEQTVSTNPLVDFSRVVPDESSDADVELFRKGLQLMLSEQTDLFNFAAQSAEEVLLKMSEVMKDSSSQKPSSKESRKRERKDISAALAGLGASSGSSNLVPNPLLNCLNQDAKPETALNNNYRSVSMAHKRANLERKIAAMRRQKEKENADCLGLGLGLGLGLEQTVSTNPLVDFSRVVPDESSDADVELFRKGLQLMLSEQTDLFNFAAQSAEEVLLKMSEVMKDSSSQKPSSKESRKRERKIPCTCEICGKKLASSFQLKEHISIQHLNERNFECEHCGTKFGRRGGLRRHVQMVHLNQTHRCPYEGCVHPGYKCSKALAAHIRSVHTNQRPYECEHCQKSFVRRNDLKMHEMTHNKTISFGCVCGSRFRRQIYLKKHQKNCQIHVTAEEESEETHELMETKTKEISTMDTETDDLAETKNIADIMEKTVAAVETEDAVVKPEAENTVVEEEDPTTTTKESD